MDFSWVTAEQREELYNEIWTEPVITVAKKYGMSDNGLRKQLRKLGIPLPPPGYWARVVAGQKVSKPALSRITGELKKYIRHYVIKYKPNFEELSDEELRSNEDLSLLTDETKEFIKTTCLKVQVPTQLRNPHKLITDHEKESLYRKHPEKRERDKGKATYSVRINGRYDSINAMLPIHVSPPNIKRAYRIINSVIRVLEEMEASVTVNYDFTPNKDVGTFNIMSMSFNFELTEVIRKHKDNKMPSSSLVLSLSPRSWRRSETGSKMECKDLADKPLESQLGKMIYDMFVVANQFRCLDILYERKCKKQQEEKKRQERLEQMRNGELAEVKLLEQAVSDWDKAEKIRRFADAMEQKIIEVNDENKKDKLIRWLKWARDKADWIDPLTEKEDELLGRSKQLFESVENDDF